MMKISGFSFVRNGFEYGVPFLESIQSILPVCDELIVAVGDSTDGTRTAIEKLGSEKIKILDTVWDMQLRKGGKIFAQQTNLALDQVSGDWAFHLQADEVIHEKDLPAIRRALEESDTDRRVEGFILPFLHFWGGYNYVRDTRRVHNFEVRIFRSGLQVRSYRDSQGFRKYSSLEAYDSGAEKGKKLQVRKIDATIYHYNGIRPPSLFRKKAEQMGAFYKSDADVRKNLDSEAYGWHNIDRVRLFAGTHPAVMQPKASAQDWQYEYDPKKSVWKKKDRILQPVEDFLGFKFGEYRNYKLIK